jgi:hypothetical protein
MLYTEVAKMMHLQFDAAQISKLGTPALWLHSSQSNEDTGSVWISSRHDSHPPRIYAAGCGPGTPLSYINANIDSYDTLRDPIDISSVLKDLSSHKYLNVFFEHDFSFSTTDTLGDPEEIEV